MRAVAALVVAAAGAAALSPNNGLYLGLDLSTQSVTAVVVDATLDVVHRHTVNFDASFPGYGTENGYHAGDDATATSPVSMWLDGLDATLDALPASLLQEVDGISFSGQQHGSVYWTRAAAELLRSGPDPDAAPPPADVLSAKLPKGAAPPAPLRGGLRAALCPGAFALADSPIWADASTQTQCDALEEALGGPEAVAERTGSRAYARFTGHQMAAVAARAPAAWAATARVSLVSAFGPSVLCGGVAPVDASDSTGTNVGALRDRAWDADCVDAFGAMPGVGGADAFRRRLGASPAPPAAAVGRVSAWVARRFGFRGSGASTGAPFPTVYAGAGDNPCTAAGLGLAAPGDVALSLGTSDTFMAVSADAAPRLEGHVFASCTAPDEYLALLCYANGAKVRERCKRDFLGPKAPWDLFGAAVARAPPLNDGVLGLDLALPEITPTITTPGRFYVDGGGAPLRLGDGEDDAAATAARAVVEGRFLSMRGRGAALGVDASGGRVLAAGGATKSPEIVQCAADVLGADVYAADEPDAAALGAAYRAAHAAAGAPPYDAFLKAYGRGASALNVIARPRAAHLYTDELVARYLKLEDDVRSGAFGGGG